MAIVKLKQCLPLVLIVLSACLIASTVATSISPKQEFEKCQSKCQHEEDRPEKRRECLQECAERMKERSEESPECKMVCHRYQIDPHQEVEECVLRCPAMETNPNPNSVDPEKERYRHCQDKCKYRATVSEKRECEQECRESSENHHIPEEKKDKYMLCKQVCQKYDPSQSEECERQCQKSTTTENHHIPEVKEDKYRLCKQVCQKFDPSQRQECERQCQKSTTENNNYDIAPSEKQGDKYRLCKQVCERTHKDDPSQRQECEQKCWRTSEEEERYGESEGRRWNENPYHFQSHAMQARLRTSEGSIRVLEKLNERSKLLKGIQNYRIVVLEASPGTLIAPHHLDADSVLVVTKGKGTISIIRQNKKESYNVEVSDTIIAKAGSTVYYVNEHQNNQPLQITSLVASVNIPGQFEAYYPGGGETPQSYFKAFSADILKQSLSATEEQIERLVGEPRDRRAVQQRAIVRGSEEQLRALSQHATSPSRKGGRKSGGPVIGLKNLSPKYSNEYGNFYEADPQEQKQLQDIDVLVNWAEIKQGTIMVPHFNSKATILIKVVEGTARVEMGCPHLAQDQQQQEQQQQQTGTGMFQKVTATLSTGDIFIIPAGHPVAVLATEGQTLKIVGFGVNALDNERVFIAGKDNMMRLIEREAKELVFNMRGSEIEELFNQQKLSHFVPQKSSPRETHPMSSILNFVSFA